jgi:undecaprenyl-diphosphatase
MDQKLFLLINGVWTSGGVDRLMAIMSSLDWWLPLLIVAVVAAAWRGSFRVRAFLIVALLTVGVADGVVSNPRPADAMAGVRQVDLGKGSPRMLATFKKLKVRISPEPKKEPTQGRSFPSSHTVNVTAIATVATLFFRRRGWLAFIPALLVAYSRVYTGSHWPSDVAGSMVLGVVTGLGCVVLADWVWRRWLARRFGREPGSLMKEA